MTHSPNQGVDFFVFALIGGFVAGLSTGTGFVGLGHL